MTKTTTKLLSTCAALAMISTTAMADDRDTNLDKMMYTVNPLIKLSGPVYKDNSDAATKGRYASELVTTILKKAHVQAKSYLEAGDYKAYNAVLALALVVPLHEGLYLQYRNVNGTDACGEEANSGALVAKTGETNTQIFQQYFKSGPVPFLPNCSDINASNVTQMIRGGDGTDLSVMQVSIRWHVDEFLAKKKYESLEGTIEYGISHLMKGFNPVYRNIKEYKCIASGGGGIFKKKPLVVNYVNLVRGIWAGQYNSGNISKTCRFDEFNSPYKGHDRGFERNVNKLLNFDGSNIQADLVGTFKLEADVAAAFQEVSNNLKNGTNDNRALNALLNK